MPRRPLTPSSKPDEDLAVSAPEANAYELQSSGVIEMLGSCSTSSETTLERKEEMNSRHAYDMLMQDLAAQMANAERNRDEKADEGQEMASKS